MSGHDGISVKKSDFSEWYTQSLIKSELFDYSAVSGCIVFRPDGYFIWESIQKFIDIEFKNTGISNVYFPLLIPEKLFEKEKEHVKGFSPEVAWVTHGGNSKLDERLAIRPTSETIIYDSAAKWVKSWRDLPLRLNQWCSVIRWEFKHPTPLLRNREFLWNEGHTIFADKQEAQQERDVILGIYNNILKNYLALPGVIGQKTETEKFAGAVASYSIELLLPDGKMVQGPDFHSDGQNFSKAFDIKFLNKEGNTEYAYQNTFAITTRVIGIMLAIHGDDKGLVIPPKVSRIQIVIIPIFNNETKQEVLAYSSKVYEDLKSQFRAYLYDLDIYSPGSKFNECELKGIPLRIEVGKREMQENILTIVRRDNSEKIKIKNNSDAQNQINNLLDQITLNLYNKAKEFLESSIVFVDNYDELKKVILDSKIAQAAWCGDEKCEKQIKADTTAKSTNMPFDAQNKSKNKKCVYCNKNAKYTVNFAKSY
ncbi:MAG: proline--tRNA ligase [Candidatus Marsarchaeota archaeon]|nr:proline--tRNA ligase [Candidatus Marsarchaeota archaeon]MCL5094835.1 proline--tRNA ligase [Candidatus Marsarchaeota archaeon]